MTENGDVDYYLPAGKWAHVLDGRVTEVGVNGQWMTENYDFMSLPLWKRIG
jgi:alpha-D-xyloside xylohydrolase